MFKSLRNKLVILYSMSTGFILIIVIIVLLVYTEKEIAEKRLATFHNNVSTITNKLQFENTINHSWLSQLEKKNNLLMHIEDNGIPLTYKGVLLTPTNRNQLMQQLTTLAFENGIDIKKNPIFYQTTKSNIFTIKGAKDEIYYGCAVIIPTDSGWRSLLLLQFLPNYSSVIFKQRILFCLLAFAGIIALFLVSLSFVSRILKPLEESNRRQTRFIAAASHELRSPLSVIHANNAAITDASQNSQKFINGIDKECKRMSRLIDDMLLLASIDAKSWHMKKEPVETDTLLLETYEMFLPLFRQNERTLTIELPERELPVLYGDKERLQQVLAILLDNALSYTPIHKRIILRGFISNNHINLEVEDQGLGIDDQEKKLIFDRFYRVDQSRNDKKHFGLGLSIAKELVQLQGGKISVRDTVGGGATFVVRFRII
ncbi:HAMP domain-containing histidine kinase [Mobilitalea sibirica]|uniref:histidine kinase n=1 Tax=Mobilitalea sibirica TaxID=1462919 RepID=A0A8J7H0G7_9FIRM|nr:HAMP domain-containing sensor histidine kinase [Mobilitalea sibirica]MBH1939599.1 HAMP domain-containing histidine kinase [Mobilitalea sibirica]